ncbi:hypothetical protein [Streptomyces sp. NBC_01481]|uniref:hypothetical protein n=1 Tax=Streptomyces sp. NBC_01481 TaxID=2975869 RepID=UPI002250224C|nr:hypothetical protein [Streptomyces sp. NBC_01481]MCX4587206.1 hypothetical protein [Streptomyces sp. NBC_01481]
MNSTQEYTTPVVVTLSSCAKEDAHSVFRLLRQSFASDRADDDVPDYTLHDTSDVHTSVWTSTFEVAPSHAKPGPVRLTAPVRVDLQGTYWGVDRMTETLADAFAVKAQGMAAGDQEKDVQLLLESGSG